MLQRDPDMIFEIAGYPSRILTDASNMCFGVKYAVVTPYGCFNFRWMNTRRFVIGYHLDATMTIVLLCASRARNYEAERERDDRGHGRVSRVTPT